MDHLSVYQQEVCPMEQQWLTWCAQVETYIGYSLDGDQKTQGYSIDYAHNLYLRGYTPWMAAYEITINKSKYYPK